MLKSDLVALLVKERNLPEKKAELVVDTIFKAMASALARGEHIELRGFGSFLLRSYAARTGHNPKTNQPISVPAKRGLLFRPGKELRERVDRKRVRAAPDLPAAASSRPKFAPTEAEVNDEADHPALLDP